MFDLAESKPDYIDAVLALLNDGRHDEARVLLYESTPPDDREAAVLFIAALTTTML